MVIHALYMAYNDPAGYRSIDTYEYKLVMYESNPNFCKSIEVVKVKAKKDLDEFPYYEPLMILEDDMKYEYLLVTHAGEVVYLEHTELTMWCHNNVDILKKLKTGKRIKDYFKL